MKTKISQVLLKAAMDMLHCHTPAQITAIVTVLIAKLQAEISSNNKPAE